MLKALFNHKKTMSYVLAGLVVVILLLLITQMVISNVSNQEVSAESRQASGKYAQVVYSCSVEDLNDTAAVAGLLEAMDMEAVSGEYAVEIAPEGDVYTLSFALTDPVKEEKQTAFDQKMEKKAQQLLALIPQLGKVQWDYVVKTADGKEKAASVSVDTAAAKKSLGEDARDFGSSQRAFKELLSIQSERK